MPVLNGAFEYVIIPFLFVSIPLDLIRLFFLTNRKIKDGSRRFVKSVEDMLLDELVTHLSISILLWVLHDQSWFWINLLGMRYFIKFRELVSGSLIGFVTISLFFSGSWLILRIIMRWDAFWNSIQGCFHKWEEVESNDRVIFFKILIIGNLLIAPFFLRLFSPRHFNELVPFLVPIYEIVVLRGLLLVALLFASIRSILFIFGSKPAKSMSRLIGQKATKILTLSDLRFFVIAFNVIGSIAVYSALLIHLDELINRPEAVVALGIFLLELAANYDSLRSRARIVIGTN